MKLPTTPLDPLANQYKALEGKIVIPELDYAHAGPVRVRRESDGLLITRANPPRHI